MLVIPAHQLRGDLLRPGFCFSLIHCLLDGPARGAFADLDRHTGRFGRTQHRLAQVSSLFHFHQEFAYHIATKPFVI